MKLQRALTLAIVVAASGSAVAARPIALQPDDVAQFASKGFGELSIAGAGPPGQSWATWDTGHGGETSVHLALLDRKPGPARIVWSSDWTDSYEPRLTIITRWHYGKAPVLALTLQQGAAAESVLLFGIGDSGQPIMLARRDASAVQFGSAGQDVVVLINDPGSRPERECLGWDGATHRLVATSCRLGASPSNSPR